VYGSWTHAPDPDPRWLLIDGTGGTPVPNSAVLIQDDRIIAVGSSETVGTLEGAQVIDAHGMVVLPGLIDAHVHLMHESEFTAPMYLEAGVTTVRDTGGALPAVVAWRAAQQDGTCKGPRLLFCGPIIDLAPPVHPAVTAIVDSVESAQATVDEIAAADAWGIKIYAQIPPDLARTIIARASEHGLPATGDLGATRASEAIDAGIYGLEHASVAYQDLVPVDRQVGFDFFHQHGAAQWRREWNRGMAEVDASGRMARQLARQFANAGVFLDPTLVVIERLARITDPDVTAAPGVAEMPDSIRSGWEARAASRRDNWSPQDFELAQRAFEVSLAFTAEVRRASGKLLVGSDAPNPFVVPGASLHRELELLVAAGLSPMAVLVAATHGNAEALGLSSDLGTLAQGKLADLVLLDADPLDDITNSRRVRVVLQAGEVVAGSV
jgi:Amidohydrolase family